VDVLALDDYAVFEQRYYDEMNALSDGKVLAIAETANPPTIAIYLDFPVGLQLNICRRPPSAILHILTSAMRRTNSFPPRDRPFGHSLGVFAAILGRSIGVVAATLTDPSR